jgi:transposase-like protein
MAKLKTVEELFKGRDVVILCVRWYLRFKLSLRDLVEMMVERGLSMAHTTIMRWVQRYAPETLAPICPSSRPVMAGRRDIRQDQRQMVLPVSCR